MVGIVIDSPNTLTRYKSNVAIKKSDVKKHSIAKAAVFSTTDSVVVPEITTNADAQYKADRQTRPAWRQSVSRRQSRQISR